VELNVGVFSYTWFYFELPAETKSARVHIVRTSQQGDPDFYLHPPAISAYPSLFNNTLNNTECDSCKQAVTDHLIDVSVAVLGNTNDSKFLPQGFYRMSAWGYCCDASRFSVQVLTGSNPPTLPSPVPPTPLTPPPSAPLSPLSASVTVAVRFDEFAAVQAQQAAAMLEEKARTFFPQFQRELAAALDVMECRIAIHSLKPLPGKEFSDPAAASLSFLLLSKRDSRSVCNQQQLQKDHKSVAALQMKLLQLLGSSSSRSSLIHQPALASVDVTHLPAIVPVKIGSGSQGPDFDQSEPIAPAFTRGNGNTNSSRQPPLWSANRTNHSSTHTDKDAWDEVYLTRAAVLLVEMLAVIMVCCCLLKIAKVKGWLASCKGLWGDCCTDEDEDFREERRKKKKSRKAMRLRFHKRQLGATKFMAVATQDGEDLTSLSDSSSSSLRMLRTRPKPPSRKKRSNANRKQRGSKQSADVNEIASSGLQGKGQHQIELANLGKPTSGEPDVAAKDATRRAAVKAAQSILSRTLVTTPLACPPENSSTSGSSSSGSTSDASVETDQTPPTAAPG